MSEWPDGEALLSLLSISTGPHTRVRDCGTLVAAAHRPHAILTSGPCYPDPVDQAAALLHAILMWEPLDFWNSGLAWAALRTFFIKEDIPFGMPAKDRMELNYDITSGDLTSVRDIAARLRPYMLSR
jgi:death on curing protein